MSDYFTSDHFELLKKWQGQKRDESNAEQNHAYDELKKAYSLTERWAQEIKQRLFPAGEVKIRKRPTSQANSFLPYNWARIYPTKSSPNPLAYTVGIDADGLFVVKIDTVQADPELRAIYEKVRGPYEESSIVALLSARDGLSMSLNELVDWSIEAINNFKLGYVEIARMLGLLTDDDPMSILHHFQGHTDFVQRQPLWSEETTSLFCRLATAVHEAEFDWWFTKSTNSQLRFGHKEKGAAKGDPIGWIFLMREGLKISWKPFTDREGSDMVPLTVDLASDLERYFTSIGHTKKDLFPGLPARLPYWPDDYAGEELTVEELPQKAQKIKGEGFNRIYYGPPGTGKTYLLTQFFENYTISSAGESKESYLARLVADKPWWQVIGAAVLDRNKAKVPALVTHSLIQAKLTQTNIQSPNARLWATLQSHTMQDCPHVNYQKKLEPQFFWKEADSTWSVKEELLQELAPEILELKKSAEKIPATETIRRYEFVTFHQSFGYEEFVEGIRPVMEDTIEGDVQYRVEPGIFKKICQRAEKDPANEYAIFIDEINRGNISKIFGELITLIEHDKRVRPDGTGLRARLPYSKEEFGVPANLSIVGTMNTADRSIAFIDIALRRRFQFEEMMPDLDLIERKVGTIDGVNVKSLLDRINRRIEFLYDRDHMIGHSYFLNCTTLEGLRDVFLQNIIPLLQEYFYGDWEKICLVLGCGTNGNGGATKNQHPLVNAEVLVEKEILGFDHLDFDDCCRYEVHPDFSKATGEKLKDYLTAIYQPHAKSADTQEG